MEKLIVRVPKEINYVEVFVLTTLLFPILTNTPDNDYVNKIVFGVLIVEYLLLVFQKGMSKRSFALIVIMLVNYVFALTQTSFPMQYNLNLLFYYPYMVLYTTFVLDYSLLIRECFIKNKNFVLIVINVWTIVTGISILLPSSYYVKEAGSLYFGSLSGTIFRLGPSAMFIVALIMISMSFYGKKQYIFYAIIPMYCFFMGSSRIYFFIGICLFIVMWYWFAAEKKYFYLSIILLSILALFLIFNSSIGDKILYTLDASNSGDFWYRVTSSRSYFWAKLINAWVNQPLLNKLFGSGIEYSNQVIGLWAHNDFLELICSFGILGLLEYCYLMILLLRKYFTTKIKIPLVLAICIVSSWLINACFNMHYVYFCALLSYPIILCSMKEYYSDLNTKFLTGDN
ncbi:MAG: hypothetical protein R3Y35_06920 [Clostridia bacterium]